MAEANWGGCTGDLHPQSLEGQRVHECFSRVIHERESAWDHPRSCLRVIWRSKKITAEKRWKYYEMPFGWEGVISGHLKRDTFISNKEPKAADSSGSGRTHQHCPWGKGSALNICWPRQRVPTPDLHIIQWSSNNFPVSFTHSSPINSFHLLPGSHSPRLEEK